jgi:hypothetical protein
MEMSRSCFAATTSIRAVRESGAGGWDLGVEWCWAPGHAGGARHGSREHAGARAGGRLPHWLVEGHRRRIWPRLVWVAAAALQSRWAWLAASGPPHLDAPRARAAPGRRSCARARLGTTCSTAGGGDEEAAASSPMSDARAPSGFRGGHHGLQGCPRRRALRNGESRSGLARRGTGAGGGRGGGGGSRSCPSRGREGEPERPTMGSTSSGGWDVACRGRRDWEGSRPGREG